MGSLRTLKRNAVHAEINSIVLQLGWFRRQLLMGMADGVRFINSLSGTSLGYDGAMHDFGNNALIEDMTGLKLIALARDHEYLLTPLGMRISQFIQQKYPYHYLIQFTRPGETFQGSKWVASRKIVETGKLVRQEIAECVRQGILPSGKYRYRTRKKRYKEVSVSLRLPNGHYDWPYLDHVDCILRGILYQYTQTEEGESPDIWVSTDISTE